MVKDSPKFPYRNWALRVEESLLLKREKGGEEFYCREIFSGGFSYIGEVIVMRSYK